MDGDAEGLARDGQVDWIHRRIVNASNEISSIIRIR